MALGCSIVEGEYFILRNNFFVWFFSNRNTPPNIKAFVIWKYVGPQQTSAGIIHDSVFFFKLMLKDTFKDTENLENPDKNDDSPSCNIYKGKHFPGLSKSLRV